MWARTYCDTEGVGHVAEFVVEPTGGTVDKVWGPIASLDCDDVGVDVHVNVELSQSVSGRSIIVKMA